jgi:hypothetical protein
MGRSQNIQIPTHIHVSMASVAHAIKPIILYPMLALHKSKPYVQIN